MKIGLFTKGILTVIAVALGVIGFDTKPVKQAQTFVGGYEVIPTSSAIFWVSDGKRIKLCRYKENGNGSCYRWHTIK